MTGGSSSSGPPGRRLAAAFFDRPTVQVARALLGARLTVRGPDGPRTARLVETEAYLRGDPASHAFLGPTVRNRSMFGPPGTVYVFRIHQVVCANLVTRPGEAALLRAGVVAGAPPSTASGPGRLARALGITLEDDGRSATEGPRFAVLAGDAAPGAIVRGPRVGVAHGVGRPLRFALAGEPAVSRPRPS